MINISISSRYQAPRRLSDEQLLIIQLAIQESEARQLLFAALHDWRMEKELPGFVEHSSDVEEEMNIDTLDQQ